MEVKNENSALLSNQEVLMLLKDIQAGRNDQQKPNKHQQNLGTITYETIRYLENTPCGLQTPEHVGSFMQAVKGFGLTKAEKLQLLNSRPTTMVEIHLMVEESEERFTTDEEMEQLRDTVVAHLPGPQPPSPAAADEEDEEDVEENEEGEGGGGGLVGGMEEDYVAI
ncbi:DNA-directed RNA polymerase III subunit RPC9-like [Babylonia areolata]|uniref:DNA-directed RNA polymerase III subunit RPC9-like n=1 Tax=Babylonia areolata TaxID=304850 RepID=UPI003FD30705